MRCKGTRVSVLGASGGTRERACARVCIFAPLATYRTAAHRVPLNVHQLGHLEDGRRRSSRRCKNRVSVGEWSPGAARATGHARSASRPPRARGEAATPLFLLCSAATALCKSPFNKFANSPWSNSDLISSAVITGPLPTIPTGSFNPGSFSCNSRHLISDRVFSETGRERTRACVYTCDESLWPRALSPLRLSAPSGNC
jgi:hypothetical protein